jgi:hypothetical protein
VTNVPLLGGDDDNGGVCTCLGKSIYIGTIYSAHFCSEPKTALKNVIQFLKNGKEKLF